jgi:hypothetical protein
MPEDWKWAFLGFESSGEGRPVQSWFDALPEDEQDVVVDTLVYLENLTTTRWPKESYDPLAGAGGISEIRFSEFRGLQHGTVQRITLRIYGFFGPKEQKRSYTFLHGTDKKVKNDAQGKSIGKRRLDELLRGEATIHKFNFK